MTWARYDDQLPMNRKWARLRAHGETGAAAMGLHLLANTFARHNGTAGRIEPHDVEMLIGKTGLKLARLLVDVGMFDADGDGWMIHDYAEYHDPNDPNPDRSAADRQRELSEKRAAAGRLGGVAKAGNRLANPSNAVAKPEQTPSPVPVPVPTDTSNNTTSMSVTRPTSTVRGQSVARLIAAEIEPGPHVRNEAAWRRSVYVNVLKDHGAEIETMLLDGMEPDEIVSMFDGDAFQPPQPPPPQADPSCTACEGFGWVNTADEGVTAVYAPCRCLQSSPTSKE